MRAILRFLSVMGEERSRTWQSLIYNLVVTQGTLIGGVIGAAALGHAVVGRPWPLLPTALALSLIAAVVGVCTWLESLVSHELAYRLLGTLRMKLFAAFARLVPSGLKGRRTGDLATSLVGDVETLEWLLAHTVVQTVSAALTLGVGLVAATMVYPMLLLVLIPGAVVLGLIPVVGHRRAATQADAIRAAMGELRSQVVETVHGAADLNAVAAMPARSRAVLRESSRLARHQHAHARRSGGEAALIDASRSTIALVTVGVVVGAVARGSVQPEWTLVALVVAMTALAPAAQIAGLVREYGVLRTAMARLMEVLEAPPTIAVGPASSPPLDPAQGIVVRDLHFAYSDGPPVLRGVDLDVPIGRTVALAGASGCGKTTLVQLLLRLWNPASGTIMIGGRPLLEISEERLRGFVSPVLQDVEVFAGTVAANVALGRPDATPAELAAAARTAGFAEVVRALPEGWNTVIGERGHGLSGGQRARLALARALVVQAPVLILDEAIAHLDPAMEQQIASALRTGADRRATLVVAHREETLAAADEVVYLGPAPVRVRVG